jgi:hypothetical protein
MIELATAKEQALNNLSTTGTAAQQRPRKEPAVVVLREPDPIDLRVLTELEANQLFEQFVLFLPTKLDFEKLTPS